MHGANFADRRARAGACEAKTVISKSSKHRSFIAPLHPETPWTSLLKPLSARGTCAVRLKSVYTPFFRVEKKKITKILRWAQKTYPLGSRGLGFHELTATTLPAAERNTRGRITLSTDGTPRFVAISDP